ncbi:pilus assembly protein TadG-related protein [Micromonospora siamensis]|uniref:Putative Flp pilus-assembly TadE/G-like n=1 Tax=Micromonospora siamensis TaxID=299152 RepID=A0A1C5GT22_9ACTN|nr:pilus assembly protein TadG-related protein [Micromonospora siamensis]SCG36942.1 Putative Flp pilus-assembly TadE/G-like [Micromonospora siamensis]
MIVALLLGSGVLLGLAALVVDVGNLYVERAQLQGGADAAAVRVAQRCAVAPDGCASVPADSLAEGYAGRNANDGVAAAEVCGPRVGLGDCPAPTGSLTDCVRAAPATGPYVEVHTGTRQRDGTTVLPPVFAQAVLDEFDGVRVSTCARAAWGAPARATVLPLALSACDWNRYGRTPDGVGRSFPVYDETASTTCAPGGGTGGGPGGFRWLTDAAPGCRLTVAVGRDYDVNTGDSVPNECRNADLDALARSGRPVLVPVFGAVTGSGGSAEYTVSGVAAFVVTGWRLPGIDTGPACAGAATTCVSGYFTRTIVPGGGVVGGPDLGARIVTPVG